MAPSPWIKNDKEWNKRKRDNYILRCFLFIRLFCFEKKGIRIIKKTGKGPNNLVHWPVLIVYMNYEELDELRVLKFEKRR